jgi:hypothetical protein
VMNYRHRNLHPHLLRGDCASPRSGLIFLRRFRR